MIGPRVGATATWTAGRAVGATEGTLGTRAGWIGTWPVTICGVGDAVGTDVLVGGTAVLVGGTEVLVGGTAVLVGGTEVFVGGTDVLVGGTDVFVGGTGVLVGVLVGGTGVAVGGINNPFDWTLRSWFLLPDPSSCCVRICQGAPLVTPDPLGVPGSQ